MTDAEGIEVAKANAQIVAMQNESSPAHPVSGRYVPSGLTKLEWVSTQIAAGIASDGFVDHDVIVKRSLDIAGKLLTAIAFENEIDRMED